MNFKVSEGEFLSIMGSPGKGKSALLDDPTEGYQYFMGEAVQLLKEK